MPAPGSNDYWCRGCDATSPAGPDGRPTGWYRVTLAQPGPPVTGQARPGWYCSEGCLCRAAMLALGVPAPAVDAWLET